MSRVHVLARLTVRRFHPQPHPGPRHFGATGPTHNRRRPMRRSIISLAAAAVLSFAAVAADTTPKAQSPNHPTYWSKLKLTDQLKSKISEIRADSAPKITAIRQAETAALNQLLTDDQRKQLEQ